MQESNPLNRKISVPAALSAVLVNVALNMGEWHNFTRLRKWPGCDSLVFLSAFALTVVVDLTVAVEVGMVLAAQERVDVSPRFPPWVGAEPKKIVRNGWCTGDLAIACVLARAGHADRADFQRRELFPEHLEDLSSDAPKPVYGYAGHALSSRFDLRPLLLQPPTSHCSPHPSPPTTF